MPLEEGDSATRALERGTANRIYFILAAVIGGLVSVYFVLVPVIGMNLAFHFYLMLWITMASAFNVTAGFSGYMPFGYVAFYGIGAFTTAILVQKLGFPVLAALPFAGLAGVVLGLVVCAHAAALRHLLCHRQPCARGHLPAGHQQPARGHHGRLVRTAPGQPGRAGPVVLRHDAGDAAGARHHPVAFAFPPGQGPARGARRRGCRRHDGRGRGRGSGSTAG